MSCWLTEEFDGGGKLINVVQFQGDNWSFVNFRGVIDETYNFMGVIAYLLEKIDFEKATKNSFSFWG